METPLTDAQRQLCERNTGLVHTIARRHPAVKLARMSLEDAVSAGYVGLAYAAKGYDPSKGFRFSTYAWYSIRRHISYAQTRNALVPIPTSQYALGELPGRSVRYDPLLHDDGKPPDEEPFERNERAAKAAELLERLTDGLTPKELEALQLRWGLAGRTKSTLREAGRLMGLSNERIRQLADKAIQKIRKRAKELGIDVSELVQ